MPNRFKTTNYEDFRKSANELFGGGFKTFSGNRRPPHQAEILVIATDNHTRLRLQMTGPLPESFPQEFGRAVPLNDIEEFDAE